MTRWASRISTMAFICDVFWPECSRGPEGLPGAHLVVSHDPTQGVRGPAARHTPKNNGHLFGSLFRSPTIQALFFC